MNFEIKKIGFHIRIFLNSGRISNMNDKLNVEAVTYSRTKVYEKI